MSNCSLFYVIHVQKAKSNHFRIIITFALISGFSCAVIGCVPHGISLQEMSPDSLWVSDKALGDDAQQSLVPRRRLVVKSHGNVVVCHAGMN